MLRDLQSGAPGARLSQTPCVMCETMSKDKQQPIFRVIFFNEWELCEIYSRQIYRSELWGFLEIEELVFGERSQMLVDPGEEKLKSQFEGVNRSFIPLHAILSIDEVERAGQAKISEAKGGGNVMSFPMPPGPGPSQG